MRSLIVVVLMAACAVYSNSAFAATFDIDVLPQGDGFYHDETGRSYDYFDSSSASISAHYQYWGTSDSVSYNTGYLEFALGSFSSDLTSISSITLNLLIESAYAGDDSPFPGYLRHVSSSATATGNASDRRGGDELVAEMQEISTPTWVSFDVTNYVLNDLTSGFNWSCFSLNPNTTGYFRYAGYSVASAESGNPSFLRVTTSGDGGEEVPEPATLLIFSAGLAGMFLRRRRS